MYFEIGTTIIHYTTLLPFIIGAGSGHPFLFFLRLLYVRVVVSSIHKHNATQKIHYYRDSFNRNTMHLVQKPHTIGYSTIADGGDSY